MQGLLVKQKPCIEKARLSLETARRYIKKGKDNLEIGNYDISMFCCYTAMFHAARALLFKDGVKERSHVCVVLYLKSRYADLRHEANLLDAYRRIRHTALYSLEFTIAEEDVKDAIKNALLFHKKIKGLLE